VEEGPLMPRRKRKLDTVGECVGGCADGMLLDPPDPAEPDDWPDRFQVRGHADDSRGQAPSSALSVGEAEKLLRQLLARLGQAPATGSGTDRDGPPKENVANGTPTNGRHR
jgi:hypothetical protein